MSDAVLDFHGGGLNGQEGISKVSGMSTTATISISTAAATENINVTTVPSDLIDSLNVIPQIQCQQFDKKPLDWTMVSIQALCRFMTAEVRQRSLLK